MAPTADADLVTTGEAARILGVSRQHIVDMCDRGDLPCMRVGTHRRLRRGDLERFATPSLTREAERSLWLHQAVAVGLLTDPVATLAKARRNIVTQFSAHRDDGTRRWIEQWQVLLDGRLDRILDVLTSRSEHAIELRQNSPFTGVLPEEERQRILTAFQVHWRTEHAA